LCQRVLLVEVGEDLFDHQRVFSAIAPALLYLMHRRSRMQAMILIAPPQAWQVSMSMLNTRFKRCAQVIDAQRSGRWRS
jgi:hypothetical protein